MSQHGLDTETVEHGPEYLIVVKARTQPLVQVALVRPDPVDDALIEVGSSETPDAAGEVDVVGVVHLREVIHGSGKLRKRQDIAPPLVVDLDKALFDVDIGRSVLAHGPELDEVRVRGEVTHAEEDVECSLDVVALRRDRVLG